MKCQICGKKTKCLKEKEGLIICVDCCETLGIEWIKPYKVKHNRSRINVHMNGAPCAAPRPYGQLPYHG